MKQRPPQRRRNIVFLSSVLAVLCASTVLLTANVMRLASASPSTSESIDSNPQRNPDEQIIINTATPTRTPTPINIGNFVWDDFDGDGRQDAGEPGMAGVTVQLWNDAKNDLIDQDVTDANGNYTVIAPLPGNYRVRVVLPAINDEFSPKDNAAAGNNADSDINPSGGDFGFTDVFNIASNVISITNIDAGIIKFRTATPTRTPTPVNIGNFVWNDLDADGIQDAGEPGIGGVTVQLWNPARTFMYDQTTTNASGNYTVVAPIPGDYRVRVILIPGADFSPKDQGASDTLDSDVNTSPIFPQLIGYTSTFTIASNVISIVSIDAGMTNVPAATPTGSATPTPTDTRTPTITATFTSTPTNTVDPFATPTQTATVTPTPTVTDTVDPLATPTPTPTDTATPTNTDTPDPLATATPTPTDTATQFPTNTPSDTPTPTDTDDPLATPTETPFVPPATYEPTFTPTEAPFDPNSIPPNTPSCDLRNFAPDDIVRAGIRPEFDLFCRTLIQDGEFMEFNGLPLTTSGNVGIDALFQLGIIHAVDIFSPSGQTYFFNGYVMCLRGEGTLIWLDATNAPRRAEIIGSYEVPEFPGFTCATLFTPGTIVLVDINPVQPRRPASNTFR